MEDAARLAAAEDPEQAPAVTGWISKLKHRGAVFVYLDLAGHLISTFTSCYVADPALPFCRIYEPAWYLRGDERARSRALCLEYHTEDQAVGALPDHDGELIKMSVAALSRVPGYEDVAQLATGLDVVRVKQHYPLLDEPAALALAQLLPYLLSRRIFPAGRAGLFRYVNIDLAMEMGLRAADTVLGAGTFDAVNRLGMEPTFRETLIRTGSMPTAAT